MTTPELGPRILVLPLGRNKVLGQIKQGGGPERPVGLVFATSDLHIHSFDKHWLSACHLLSINGWSNSQWEMFYTIYQWYREENWQNLTIICHLEIGECCATKYTRTFENSFGNYVPLLFL